VSIGHRDSVMPAIGVTTNTNQEERNHMRKLIPALLVALVLTMSVAALGQATQGSLAGTVSDANGAIVPGAAVTIKNIATSQEMQTISNDKGEFSFPAVAPGHYKVSVTAKGFKKFEVSDVIVDVSTPAKVVASLPVGDINETVTVTASEAQEIINTTNPTLTNVITQRQVNDLPLPTRNPLDLAGLQAGVATFGTGTRNATVSGLRGSSTNVTQDGINVEDNFVKTSSFFALNAPTVEGTSEFSISTGTIGADSGRGVGQVRIVTPSGTNRLHGNASYFGENDAFNANSFFNNATGTPRNKVRQHRFGFSVGGPVDIPHVYDGRDKTFFFFSYTGFREPLSSTFNRTVLTQDARNGIFKYVDTNGVTQTVNLLSSPGAKFTTLNAVTQALINETPLPNNILRGDHLNTAGFSFNQAGSDPSDEWTVRIDHQLLQSSELGTHKLEFVTSRGVFNSSPDVLNGNVPPFPGLIGGSQTSTRILVTTAIHSSFGSNKANEIRFGHQRAPVDFPVDAPIKEPFFLTFASGITDPQNRNVDQNRDTTVYQLLDNFSWNRGVHTIRLGTDLQAITVYSNNAAGITPTVVLGTNPANSNGLSKANFPGISNTDFTTAQNIYADLVGLLASGSQLFNVNSPTSGFVPGAISRQTFEQKEANFYGQDDWRVRRNLTLNLGLRYEFLGVPTIPNGLALQPQGGIQGLFGPTPVGDLFHPDLPVGPPSTTTPINLVSGTTGRALYNNDWNNFAPSFGLAYSPSFKSGPLHFIFGDEGKSSIRGGYSISYLRDGLTVVSNVIGGGTTNPGLQQTATNSLPTGVLTNAGIPLATPAFNIPTTDAANFAINSGNLIFAYDPNLRTPYVQQWSFGIEREIARDTALEIRYVGNHAVKMYHAFDLDEVNIFENGFLNDFLAAQNNLNVCLANATACKAAQATQGITAGNQTASSFANWGLAGQANTPILSKLFGPAAAGTQGFFNNSTFVSNLSLNNVGTMANTLATNPAFINTRLLFPANFFRVNPNTARALLMTNSSFSHYNALQIEVRRRLSKGLLLQADYTFSKAITDTEGSQSDFESGRTLRNPLFNEHRADFDQTHKFIMNYIYELPIGHGRHYFSGANGVVGRAIEGWQLQGITTWQSGVPLGIVSNRATFNQLNAVLNPAEILGGLSLDQLKADTGIFRTPNGVFFFDPSILVQSGGQSKLEPGVVGSPAPGQIGNFPRNFFNGPRFFQSDFSVLKRTRITESVNVEFRAEMFNVFNNTNFNFSADQIFDSTTFGQITGTVGNPRFMQFGLRINF